MTNKGVKALILLLVIFISIFCAGCTSGKDLENARHAGYEEGYSEGYATGYEDGYEDGGAAGWEEALWEYGIKK